MKLARNNVEEIAPLTPMQEGILFHYLEKEERMYYHQQLNFRITGVIDLEVLRESFLAVIQGNGMLRTVFRWENIDRPIQITLKQYEPTYRYKYMPINSDKERESMLGDLLLEDLEDSFALTHEPYRIWIIQWAPEQYDVLFSYHHILLDGWSCAVVLEEWIRKFGDLSHGVKTPSLGKPSFKKFVDWQMNRNDDDSEQYWREKLHTDIADSLLPAKAYKTDVAVRETAVHQPSRECSDKILSFLKFEQITLAALVYSAWALLIHRYNDHDCVLFGTVVSGRPPQLIGIEKMVGLFMNTIPCMVELKDQESVTEFINRINKEMRERSEHDKTPLVKTKSLLGADNRISPFESIVVIENYPMEQVLRNGSEQILFHSYQLHEMNHFDLTLKVANFDGLSWQLDYNPGRFDSKSADRILRHFNNVIEFIIHNRSASLEVLEFLDSDEKVQYSNSKLTPKLLEGQQEDTLISAFLARVQKYADRIAIHEINGKMMTYENLYRKVTSMASKLTTNNQLRLGDSIAVIADRSVEMIISYYAILMAGGNFVPIAPDLPEERIRYCYEKSNSVRLLASRKHADLAARITSCNTIVRVEDYAEDINIHFEPVCRPNDVAYIIFTSGSTGAPKGVEIEHRQVLSTLKAIQGLYPLGASDRMLLKTSCMFDVSVAELFGWFWNGGSLVALPYTEERDPLLLLQAIRQYHISHIHFVPSHLLAILESAETVGGELPDSLKFIFAAGEALPKNVCEKSKELFPDARLVNLYGPTEAAIFATAYEVDLSKVEQTIPIGQALEGTHTMVVDKKGRLMPIGAVGELWLHGNGIARGYKGLEEQTAQKFVLHPSISGERCYRTGDLARVRADGIIEYIGRRDYQVKIRGYRIELGEIETFALQMSAISQAVAIVTEQDQIASPSLRLYYVSKMGVSEDSIRAYLTRYLPSYMIPNHFIRLNEMPINANGKIDRSILSKMTMPEVIIDHSPYQPKSNKEVVLMEIWKDVLRLQREIFAGDDFYTLGGDSIKAMQVVSRAGKKGYRLAVADVLETANLAQCSDKMVLLSERSAVSGEKTKVGEVLLSPIQREYLTEWNGKENNFLQSVLLRGSKRIDATLTTKLLHELINAHEILRMQFVISQDEIIPKYRDDTSVFQLVEYGHHEEFVSEEEFKSCYEDLIRDFNIIKGPLVRVGLIHAVDADYLLFVIHHMLVDGVSWRIIFEDLESIYSLVIQENKPALLPRTTPFQEWCLHLENYGMESASPEEFEYWKRLEERYHNSVARRFAPSYWRDRSDMEIRLSVEESRIFMTPLDGSNWIRTEEILLAIVSAAYMKWTGSGEFWLDIESHGRHSIFERADVSRTIGWFTSVYPTVIQLPEIDQQALFAMLRELRRIPNRGIGYSALKYAKKRVEGQGLRFDLSPPCLFNYLGEVETSSESVFQLVPSSFRSHLDAEAKIHYDIIFNCYMQNGIMAININYDNRLIDVQKFAGQIMDAFGKIIRIISNTGPYSLSSMQRGLLLYKQLNESSPAYMEQVAFRLTGELKPEHFESAYRSVMSRHDALRTVFMYGGQNEPMQVTEKSGFCEYLYLQAPSFDSKLAWFDLVREEDRRRGFNLSTEPPVRASVFTLDPEDHLILLSYHHIVMDGWSLSNMLQEWFDEYLSPANLTLYKEKPPQYVAFVNWLERQDMWGASLYWKKYLENYEGSGLLTLQSPEGSYQEGKRLEQRFLLEHETEEGLRRLAGLYKVSISVLIQAIWGVFLQKYKNMDDVVFGCVSTIRPNHDNFERAVGHFVTVLPLRLKASRANFKEIVLKVRKEGMDNLAHGYYPLYEIQTSIQGELLDHVLSFDNYPLDEQVLQRSGLKLQRYEVSSLPHYAFNLLFEVRDRLSAQVVCNSDLFPLEKVEDMIMRFFIIMNKVIKDPNCDVSRLSLLTEDEEKALMAPSYVAPEETCTLHELVEYAVRRYPNRTALRQGDAQMTYAELNERAEQVASALRRMDLHPEQTVGVYLDRSFELVIAILAVLKSGRAYLPLDVELPHARLEYMINQSGAGCILTRSSLSSNVTGSLAVLLIDEALAMPRTESTGSSTDKVDPKGLAYVIYTSGSTGNPKGVLIEHRSIVNTIRWRAEAYRFSEEDIFLQIASISFDSSVEDIFTALSVGAGLVILPQAQRLDLTYIRNAIHSAKVTHLLITPSLYQAMLNEIPDALILLKSVTLAGEPFGQDLVAQHYKILGNVSLYNEYGPTENSVCSTFYAFNKDNQEVLLGTPIQNVQCLVLDRHMNPLPPNVPGELCVSGPGLARGYLGLRELTEEKFVSHPLHSNTRIYKTGDLVEWTKQGELRYIGRIDQQIKIRGIRVEPAEIESKILEYFGIEHTLVLPCTEPGRQTELAAFIVAEKDIDLDGLKEYMYTQLPKSIVPNRFIQLDSFPLNTNGKIDREALRKIRFENRKSAELIKPINYLESKVQQIWSQVLQQHEIGVDDHFFDIGGNSILLTQVHSRLEQEYPGSIRIIELFDNPTIRHIGALVQKQTAKAWLEGRFNPITSSWRSKGNGGALNRDVIILDFDEKTTAILDSFGSRAKATASSVIFTLFALASARSLGTASFAMSSVSLSRRKVIDLSVVTLDSKRGILDYVKEVEAVRSIDTATSGKNIEDPMFLEPFVYDNAFMPLFVYDNSAEKELDCYRFFDVIVTSSMNKNRLYVSYSYSASKFKQDTMNDLVKQVEQAVYRISQV
jgi:amino acid adenylation domain-containing protein/non-ribosomal peptide synthase protein (TIGR01720 family)